MQVLEFEPENAFESVIVNAKQGVRSHADLTKLLAQSNLYISSKGEMQQDGSGFSPLLFEEGGHPLVAAFSSLSRAERHGHMAEYVLQMNGKEFILRLPPGYGVVLNPGYSAQLIISPSGVIDIRKDLRAR